MMRLFAGLTLPDPVIDRLQGMTGGIPGLRWVAPENLHITLRFFGDTDRAQAEDLVGALSRIEAPALSLSIDGVGLFGLNKRQRQKQLYANVRPDTALAHLNRKIEQVAQQVGYAPESRRFHPHVTLARFRKTDDGRLDQFLMANAHLFVPDFQVAGFTLFESHMLSDGAVYTPISTFGSSIS